ncbi:hypothetical protein F5Y01DRAFT_115895 [Xylaria sp. FL0043]|nr:hypothetical protein F5Y01DRAFT_115895 [Xylaria sp. FL0043]
MLRRISRFSFLSHCLCYVGLATAHSGDQSIPAVSEHQQSGSIGEKLVLASARSLARLCRTSRRRIEPIREQTPPPKPIPNT